MAKKIDLSYARQVLTAEARAVLALRKHVGAAFAQAARLVLACGAGSRGRVVATGMGKAGLIAQKITATLASTGTPAVFLHPAEARHGDLGMVSPRDLLLAFSNSGESEEIAQLLPALKKRGVKIIAITGKPHSTLGRAADLVMELGKIKEPCPLRLAPSASTTAMLALGDALALCVLKARGFTERDYAELHPGGALGRSLMQVHELMRTGARLPLVHAETPVTKALSSMTKARGGTAIVVDRRGRLQGVFTDGDFRRHVERGPQVLADPIGKHMTSPCLSIQSEALVSEAQTLMAARRINALPVVDRRGNAVGLLDIQDVV